MNEHYAAVRDSYHRAWFYAKDSPYEKWQLKLVTEAFNLNSSTARLADIGGGTGRFAGLLHAHLGLENDVTCVDMSDEMLKEAETLSGVTTRCADAASFAASLESASYDGFLLKEIVHHLGPEDCLGMYQHLVRGLRAGGMCVTVTRPKFEIDYPLFEAARTVWQNNQEDVAVYADMMRKAGFQDVRFKIERFPVTMFLSDWTHMVGNRMWSTFSEAHFSEAELQRGIQELREACATDAEGRITFDEKLVVLVGSS